MTSSQILNLINRLSGDIDILENNSVGAIHFRFINTEREANDLLDRLEDSIHSADDEIQTRIRRIRSDATNIQGNSRNSLLARLDFQQNRSVDLVTRNLDNLQDAHQTRVELIRLGLARDVDEHKSREARGNNNNGGGNTSLG